jgi:hypothetical protein
MSLVRLAISATTVSSTTGEVNIMFELIFRFRISLYPGVGRDFDLPQSSMGDVQRLLKYYSGFYDFTPTRSGNHQFGGHLQLKSGIARPTLAQMSDALRTDAEDAGRSAADSTYDLLAAVLARGEIESYYGGSFWGQDNETFHLLMCGINWDRFRGVHDTEWSLFDGTFSENDRRKSVLGSRVVCACSEEVEVSFGMEPPSLASLYAALGANALERLFEV